MCSLVIIRHRNNLEFCWDSNCLSPVGHFIFFHFHNSPNVSDSFPVSLNGRCEGHVFAFATFGSTAVAWWNYKLQDSRAISGRQQNCLRANDVVVVFLFIILVLKLNVNKLFFPFWHQSSTNPTPFCTRFCDCSYRDFLICSQDAESFSVKISLAFRLQEQQVLEKI
jgi:hypothetical protein